MESGAASGAGRGIRDRLTALANRLSEQYEFRYDPSARPFLDDLIETAEKRLVREDLLDDEQAIARTEEAFSTVILASGPGRLMESEMEPGTEMVIGSPELRASLAGLCPGFWPFC